MKFIKFIVITCLFSFSILSCGFNVEVIFDQKTNNEQRKQWLDKNINNYQYRFIASGFTGYNGIIFVEDKQFKNEEMIYGNSNIEDWEEYSTIDKIYETIEKKYIQNNNTQQSRNDFYLKAIHVKYDKINNIPVYIYYEYHVPPMLAVDGTFNFEITDFVITD